MFFAFPIPEKISEQLLAPFAERRHQAIRFVDRKNLHVTAHFIGKADEVGIEKIRAESEKIAANNRQFWLQFSTYKIIEHHHKPEMIWAAFDHHSAFEKICLELRAIHPAGESRKPQAHCTLARIKQLHQLPFSLPVIPPFAFLVDELELWESHLSSAGSDYEVVQSWKLRENS